MKRKHQTLVQATKIRDHANQTWDAAVTRVRRDPSLGVAGVTAGILPQDPKPEGATGAGLFEARLIKDFSLWSTGSDSPLSDWLQVADTAMRQLRKLAKTARDAEAVVVPLEAARDIAKNKHDVADARVQAAVKDSEKAWNRSVEALAKVIRTCGSQKGRYPIAGGGRVEVDPGVPIKDEKAVIDRLASLPKGETKDLDKVSLRDRVVPDRDKPGRVTAGTYIDKEIDLNTFGHEEETLKHEVGHHVYFRHLNESARLEWEAFYKTGDNGKKQPVGKMPTGYASTKASEGFAEVYEFLRDNKPLDPDVKRLLEKLLKKLKLWPATKSISTTTTN